MGRIRKILVVLIMVLASVVGIAGCGDPYKNMTLTIDKGSFENALERTYEYSGEDDNFDIVATISGVSKKVNAGVVFVIQDTKVLNLNGDTTMSGTTSTQNFKIVGTGETYISVRSVEGELQKDVHVSIIAHVEGMSLINEIESVDDIDDAECLPIIKGVATDLTRVVSKMNRSFIEFTPAYSTERQVDYKVYSDVGFSEIPSTASTYTIENNVITFNENFNSHGLYENIFIQAISRDNPDIETGYSKLDLLEEIDINDYKLMYSYAKYNSDENNVMALYPVEKSTTGEEDYQIYLADQFAGDVDNDSKNIFLVNANKAVPTFADVASDVAFERLDKGNQDYVYIYSATIQGKNNNASAKPTSHDGYVICNGEGEGNTNLIYFAVNYKGYEDYFDGYEISLRVTIDAFPASIVISNNDSVQDAQYSQQSSIMVFNQYVNQLGTPFYVKVLNKAGELVKSQYAYVGVMGFKDGNNNYTSIDNGDVQDDEYRGYAVAESKFFTIYDTLGNVVTSHTRVKSGSLLYVKYNVVSENGATLYPFEDEMSNKHDFVLYACSVLDNAITTVDRAKDQDGNYIKDEGNHYTYFNTLNFIEPNYMVDLKDVNLFAEDPKYVYNPAEPAGGLQVITYKDSLTNNLYAPTDNIPGYDLLTYSLADNDLVKLTGSGSSARRLWLIEHDGAERTGKAYLTAYAPNGSYDTMEITVTIDPMSADIRIIVGGKILEKNQTDRTIQMTVNSTLKIDVLINGVSYGVDLPAGYTIEDTNANSSTYVSYRNGNLIASDEATPLEMTNGEDHVIRIRYVSGDADGWTYTLGIQVTKPINYISRSNSQVEMIYKDIIKNANGSDANNSSEVDLEYKNASGTTVFYTDMSSLTKSSVKFAVNPYNASINLTNIAMQIEYNNVWYDVALNSATMDSISLEHYEVKTAFSGTEAIAKILFGSIDFTIKKIDERNYIVLEIEDVQYQTRESVGASYRNENIDIQFTVRLTYNQIYTLANSKTYYVMAEDDGNNPKLADTIYIYTNYNNPSTSKVTYVGGYKYIAPKGSDTGSFVKRGNVTYIKFGDIEYPVSQDGNTFKFTYDRYKVALSSVVNYSVSTPELTTDIEFSGLSTDDGVYTKALNQNQLDTINKFEFSYSQEPSSLKVNGLLFAVFSGNNYSHSSQFYYENLDLKEGDEGKYTTEPNETDRYRVVGAISKGSWTETTGLKIYVNYKTNRISFEVVNVETFKAKMKDFGYVLNIHFVSADSYGMINDNNDATLPVYQSFRLELRTGQDDKPYVVSDIPSFLKIKEDLTASYQLVNNIDFSSENQWEPIGEGVNAFQGKLFSGDFKSDSVDTVFALRNFKITFNRTTLKRTSYGLFGDAIGATFKNIRFENFKVSVTLSEDNENGNVNIGSLAGYMDQCSIINCSFIDSVEASSTYSKYSVGDISQIATHGIMVEGSYSNSHTTYNIGGVVGYFNGTITSVTSYVKIYTDFEASGNNIGGVAGIANGVTLNTLSQNNDIKAILYSAKKSSSGATGGVFGRVSNESTISNVDAITFIKAFDNVGGIVGSSTSKLTLDSITINPYLNGAVAVGGIIGSTTGDLTIESSKVQFTKKEVSGSLLGRSSIIGENTVGGMVGNAGAKITINYSSVMNYVEFSVLNQIEDYLTYSNFTDDQKKNSYYGNLTILSTTYNPIQMGGLIAYVGGEANISNSYVNIDATSYSTTNVKYGGFIGVHNGNKLKINYSSADGLFYYGCNKSNAEIGGFIGNVASTLNSYKINTETKYIKVDGNTNASDDITLDDYNINNSHTLFKFAKLSVDEAISGDEVLSYINNFAGVGETYLQSTPDNYDLLKIQYNFIRADNIINMSGFLDKVVEIRYITPTETRIETYIFDADKLADTVGAMKVQFTFAGVTVANSDNFTFSSSSGKHSWSTVGDNKVLTLTLGNNGAGSLTTVLTCTSPIRQYEFVNVLALNSFYNGMSTNVSIISDTGTLKNKYNHTFSVENASSNNITLSGNYVFDYYTQRAKDTSTGTDYYTTFDNLKHMARVLSTNGLATLPNYGGTIQCTAISVPDKGAELGPVYKDGSFIQERAYLYNGAYSKIESTVTDLNNYLNYDKDDTQDTDYAYSYPVIDYSVTPGFSINFDKINEIGGDYDITSRVGLYKETGTFTIGNIAYLITEGTALPVGVTNRDIYNNDYKWYFNISPDKLYVANGYPIPFSSSEGIDLTSRIPKLVIDIPAKSVTGEISDTYKDAQSGIAILNQGVAYNIEDIVSVRTIPELAYSNIIYESSNTGVFRVEGNKIIAVGEGMATLRAISPLNGEQATFTLMVIDYDYKNPVWDITGMNNSVTGGELFIPVDSGDMITITTGYSGSYTFGVRYEFDITTDITVTEVGKTTTDFLRALNLAGYSAYAVLDGNTVSISVSGLNHAVACNILGNVKVKHTLYFEYQYNNVQYTKDIATKEVTYVFSPGVYGIDGGDEFNIYVIGEHTFSVVINCDTSLPSLILEAYLEDEPSNKIIIANLRQGQVIDMSRYGIGYLTLTINSVVFDSYTKFKTYTLTAEVVESEQALVQREYWYNLRFIVEDEDLSHSVGVGVLPQEVERIYINHYTNVFFTTNDLEDVPSSNQDSYKYPSDIIIPGYTSLLQVNLYPSFGRFDYITAEVDLNGIYINQVVEVYNSGKNEQFSWFEYYSKDQTTTTNGIKTVGKYSYKDVFVDPSRQLQYNGTLFFALTADTNLSSYSANITIKGYVNGIATAVFGDTATLIIEARPDITISSDIREITFGDNIPLKIETFNTDSDFEASVKVSGSNAEFNNILGQVVRNGASYSFKIFENDSVYSIFHQYMYREFTLKVTVSKVINGMLVYDTASVTFLFVPFRVSAITLSIDGLTKTSGNVIADYYQIYQIVINTSAEYNAGYALWLEKNVSHRTINKQLADIDTMIANNISNFSILKQGTSSQRTALLYPGHNEYSGDMWLSYGDGVTSIKMIKTSMENFLWADIGITYNTAGVQVQPHEFGTFAFSDYLSITVYTNSDEDRPDPISTVEEFKAMKEDENYILMNDLYLALWEPMEANFKSLDGNGYVITLLSFADTDSMDLKSSELGYSIGVFSEISENTTIRNLTIEINPSNMSMDFTGESIYEDVVNSAVQRDYNITQQMSTADKQKEYVVYPVSIDVDINKFSKVNFGVLAGVNKGTVTNVSIVNNATSLRTIREASLQKVPANANRIIYNGDYTASINRYKGIYNTDTIRVSYMFENKDQTTSRGNNISLLVGYNTGFITNSNVENVSIAGEDYVAGLVANNSGKISSSYFKGGNIVSDATTKNNSGTGGLVATNSGEIYYSYVEGKRLSSEGSIITGIGSGVAFSVGDYSGSGIITNNYAGGFVCLNSGKINNCYAKILVSGIYASGFAYKCTTDDASIEYCYAISNVQINATTNTPFIKKSNVENPSNIIECFYRYDNKISNLSEDIAESLAESDFDSYTSFTSYAFNVDYHINAEILDSVWFIPGGQYTEVTSKYFKKTDYYSDSPQLVSANQRTLSIRYMSAADETEYAYTYGYVQNAVIGSKEVSALRGTALNPILISSAENFNNSVVKGNDVRTFRFIKDISFSTEDEVSTTYKSVFKGKLDANGMTIKNLRISADEVEEASITKLGLFKEIVGDVRVGGVLQTTTLGNESKYAVVKNINIEIAQINGMNINMVGVLAGEISDAKIYNVNIIGNDYTVQGLNAVGAVAGRIKGETDLVNILSNVSVKANYYYQYNAFSSEKGNTSNIQKFYAYMNYSATTLDEENLKHISYAGGIVGVVANNKFSNTEVPDADKIREAMYRLRRLTTTGEITISGEVVGGLFGYLSSNSNVSDCDLTATEGMVLKGSRIVGGFVGHSEGKMKNCVVVNENQDELDALITKNTKTYDNATKDYDIGVQNLFQGNAMFTGGLVGINLGGAIERSYNRVNVANKESLYAGGIAGLSVRGAYDYLYVTGSVQAYSAIGGMFGIICQVSDMSKLANSTELGFFVTDNLSTKALPEGDAKMENIVCSNIWKYSHLNVVRSTISRPNAPDAYLGMLAGYVYGITLDEDVDGSKVIELDEICTAENHIADVLGKPADFSKRAKVDLVYYKQTYTYNSLSKTTKTLVKEFGNQGKSLLNPFNNKTFDNDNLDPNDSGSSSFISSLLDTYYYNEDTSKWEKTNKNESNYKTYLNNDMRFISGKFRENSETPWGTDGAQEQAYYIFSRMTLYGSMRSLDEIYQRKYDVQSANQLYTDIGIKYTENVDTVNNVEYKITAGTKYDGKARYKIYSMYNNWLSSDWYGVTLTSEGIREDESYLYPEPKKATVEWTSNFIYTFEDLFNITDMYGTYVLMNDIYWEGTLGEDSDQKFVPIGTESNPFKGTLRSATPDDQDGVNKMSEYRTFTIFNVNLDTTASSSNDSLKAYNGGANASYGGALGIFAYAEGATFSNFNVHIQKIDCSNKQFEYVGGLVGCAKRDASSGKGCTFDNITIFGSTEDITGISYGRAEWQNSLDEIKSSGQTVNIKTRGYHNYTDLINHFKTSDPADIKTSATYVGGLAGYADGATLNGNDAKEETYYLTNDAGDWVFTPVRGTTLSANNIKFTVAGHGYQVGEDKTYTHFVGGLFGYVNVASSSYRPMYSTADMPIVENDTVSYKSIVAEATNIQIDVDITTGTSVVADEAYSRNGIYVGGYAGYANNFSIPSMAVNQGKSDNSIDIDIDVNESIGDNQINAGGLFGLLNDISLNNVLVDGKIDIRVKSKDAQANIGGLIGRAELLTLGTTTIAKDVTVKYENNSNTKTVKIAGFVGDLVSLTQTDIKDIASIATITISSDKAFVGGGFTGETKAAYTFDNVVLKSVKTTNCLAAEFGGFVGIASEQKLTFNRCIVGGELSISESSASLGGFLGKGKAQFSNCISTMNIKAVYNTSKALYVGGFVGHSTELTISDSYVSGNLHITMMGNNDYTVADKSNFLRVGGFVGYGNWSSIGGQVLNAGNLTIDYNSTTCHIGSLIETSYGTSVPYIGAIIGEQKATVNDSFNNNAIYNKDMIMLTNHYGTGYTTSELLYNPCDKFNTDNWTLTLGTDYHYPMLKWVNNFTDNTWFSETKFNKASVAQETQSAGSKINPNELSEITDATISNSAIIFTGTTLKTGLTLENSTLYLYMIDAITANPKIAKIDNMSIVHNLKVEIASIEDFVIAENQGYVVGMNTTTANHNVIGMNTGVIIGSTIATNNEQNSSPTAYVIGNNQGGVILYSHITVNITDIQESSSLFNAVDANKDKTANVITNSIIQSQITINGMHTEVDTKFSYLFKYQLYNNCMFELNIAGGAYRVFYRQAETGSSKFTEIGQYSPYYDVDSSDASKNKDVIEFDITPLYQNGTSRQNANGATYNFQNVWTWLYSRNPVQLMALSKDHFNDRELKSKSWKYIGEHYNDMGHKDTYGDPTIVDTTVEITNVYQLAYVLYSSETRFNGKTIKYVGDTSLDLKGDLAGKLWSPVNVNGKNIDLNGWTLTNVMIVNDTLYNGFIGTSTNTAISNITIRNINVVYSGNVTSGVFNGSVVGLAKDGTIVSGVGVEGFTLYTTTTQNGGLFGKVDYVGTDVSVQARDCYVAVEYVDNSSNYISANKMYAVSGTNSQNGTTRLFIMENYYAYGYVCGFNASGTDVSTTGNNEKYTRALRDIPFNGNWLTVDTITYEGDGFVIRGGKDPSNNVVTKHRKNGSSTVHNTDESSYMGRFAENSLASFDFVNIWRSNQDNNGMISSNFGFPTLNITKLDYWYDLVNVSDEVLEINNVYDLARFMKSVNGDQTNPDGNSYEGKTVKLNADIDLSVYDPSQVDNLPYSDVDNEVDSTDTNNATDSFGALWTPIGTQDKPFKGTFDGQGHTISGMNVAGSYVLGAVDTNYAGFFGYIVGASIKNIKFAGNDESGTFTTRLGNRVTIEPSSSFTSEPVAGMAVAYALDSEIQDIVVTAKVGDSDKYSRNYVKLNNLASASLGGIVGFAQKSIIFNNKVEGCLYDGDTTTSDEKYALAITTKFAGGAPVSIGGIVGRSEDSYVMSNIVDDTMLVNTANLSSVTPYISSTTGSKYGIGGIAGFSLNSRLVSNRTQTMLSIASADYVGVGGGIVGQINGGTIQESVVLMPQSEYTPKIYNASTAISNIKGFGYIAGNVYKTELTNLYVFTDDAFTNSSIKYNGLVSNYKKPVSSDYSLSTQEKNQLKTLEDWDNTDNVKLSDYTYIRNAVIDVIGTADSNTGKNVYDYRTGESQYVTGASYELSETTVAYAKLDNSTPTETFDANLTSFNKFSNSGVGYSVKSDSGSVNKLAVSSGDNYMFVLNSDNNQKGYIAVNSDYYTPAVDMITSKKVSATEYESLLFNWSSTGDALLGTKELGCYSVSADGTVYTSTITKHSMYTNWLYNLLRFRLDDKEIAFNLAMNFDGDSSGSVGTLVSTKEYPFGSWLRQTVISGSGINISIGASDSNDVGLFGYGINLAFQNITVESATVTGKYRVGTLIGYADNMLIGSDGNPKMIKYSDITIKQSVVTATAVAGGVVGEGYYIKTSGTNKFGTATNYVTTSSSVDYNYYSNATYGLNFSSGKRTYNMRYESGGKWYDRDMDVEFTMDASGNYKGAYTGGVIGLARFNVDISEFTIGNNYKVQFENGYAGGLVGRHSAVTIGSASEGYFKANKDTFLGKLVGSTDDSYLGGIVGRTIGTKNAFSGGTTYSTISDCTIGSKTNSYMKLGNGYNIVGSNYIAGVTTEFTGTITSTKNYCAVSSDGCYSLELGGLVTQMTGTIDGCENYGEVAAWNTENETMKCLGGIVSTITGVILNSKNYGSVNTSSATGYGTCYADAVGGIAGYISLNSVDSSLVEEPVTCRKIHGCENYGNVQGKEYTNEEGYITSCYTGGIVGFVTKGAQITNNTLKDQAVVQCEGYVGGIVGSATDISTDRLNTLESYTESTSHTTISGNKTETDTKVQGDYIVGGIVGQAIGAVSSDAMSIHDNTNNASITAKIYAGGIVAYTIRLGAFYSNTNEGAISGDVIIGGLIGIAHSSTIGKSGFANINEGAVDTNPDYAVFKSEEGESYYLRGFDDFEDYTVLGAGGAVAYAKDSIITYCENEGTITSPTYLGGIVGYISGGSVTYCMNKGTVNDNTVTISDTSTLYSTYESGGIGGIVGKIVDNTTDISYNTNSGTVVADNTFKTNVGGIVGYIPSTYTTKVYGNKHSGSVTGNNKIGGIVGYVQSVTAEIGASEEIKANKNTGEVTGVQYIGGIVGYSLSSITNATNEGSIGDEETENYVGGVVGYISGSVIIQAVSNIGNINGTQYVGGIAGHIVGVSIEGTLSKYIENSGEVTANSYVGGIVGSASSLSPNSIAYTKNSRDIVANATAAYAGGIVGHAALSTIKNSINSGKISGGQYIGGIVGHISSQTIINMGVLGSVTRDSPVTVTYCTNNTAIGTFNKTTYVGGIAGYVFGTKADIKNNINYANVYGNTYVGGIAGRSFSTISGSNTQDANVFGVSYVGLLTPDNTTATDSNGKAVGLNNVFADDAEHRLTFDGNYQFTKTVTVGGTSIASFTATVEVSDGVATIDGTEIGNIVCNTGTDIDKCYTFTTTGAEVYITSGSFRLKLVCSGLELINENCDASGCRPFFKFTASLVDSNGNAIRNTPSSQEEVFVTSSSGKGSTPICETTDGSTYDYMDITRQKYVEVIYNHSRSSSNSYEYEWFKEGEVPFGQGWSGPIDSRSEIIKGDDGEDDSVTYYYKYQRWHHYSFTETLTKDGEVIASDIYNSTDSSIDHTLTWSVQHYSGFESAYYIVSYAQDNELRTQS